jgi:gp16 family phage-associated protein
MQETRTAEEAKAWLEQQGKSVQAFARENSVDPATTYQVLAGRKKGLRGEAHKVAVLLGMKIGIIPSPIQDIPFPDVSDATGNL